MCLYLHEIQTGDYKKSRRKAAAAPKRGVTDTKPEKKYAHTKMWLKTTVQTIHFPGHLEFFQLHWTHSFTKQTTQHTDFIYIRKAIYSRFTCCKLYSFKMLRCYLQCYCLRFHFYPHVELYFVCGIKGNRTFSTTAVVSSALVVLWN